ncbi:MAG: hypothetical protein IT316_00330 [Anaerolineales bacterium]|nr:hypothetical protein [Anaerolineales bacterium]
MNRLFDPHWTEREYPAGGARDDLGIETLGEAILADLLPGINNQTSRARYFSFWAWVLRDFIRDTDLTHNQAAFYEWLRRREDALILAYLAHGCNSGAAGTEIGSDVWANGEQNAYPLGWKSLKSVDGGAYQLYYRGALLETNVIRRIDEDAHDNLTREVGLPLADAYEQAVKETDYVKRYLDASQLRKSDIEEYARHGCLCLLKDNDLERRRLIDTFFRFDSPDVFAVKRLATLCFFLDAIRQSEGQPLSQADFRATLYFWSYGNHHPYLPTGNFLEPAQRWRAFQLRQYFVYAVESHWGLFLHRIQNSRMSEDDYIHWLSDELDLGALGREYGLELPTFDANQLTLTSFLDAIRDALPSEAWLPSPNALNYLLNEHALYLKIRSEKSRLDVQTYLGKAMLMLALIYWRSQPWKDQPGWHYLSDSFAAGRMPLESYLRHVDQAVSDGWTLASWIWWFHRHYLWLQHRRVTLEKLVSRNQDTSKFILLYENDDRTPQYQGIGLDGPKMNAPRFPSALSILSDVGVIEPAGTGYRLLPEGVRLLEMFRDYSIPKWKEELEVDETTFPAEETTGG